MKHKNVKAVILDLCKQEGGKREVDVAQVTQLVSKLSLMLFKSELEYIGNVDSWAKHSIFRHMMKLGRKHWLKETKGK